MRPTCRSETSRQIPDGAGCGVHHRLGQRFIHGHPSVAEPFNAFFVSQRLQQRLTETNAECLSSTVWWSSMSTSPRAVTARIKAAVVGPSVQHVV